MNNTNIKRSSRKSIKSMKGGASNTSNSIQLTIGIVICLIAILVFIISHYELVSYLTSDYYKMFCLVLFGFGIVFIGSSILNWKADNFMKPYRHVIQILIGILPSFILLLNVISEQRSPYIGLSESIILLIIGLICVVFGYINMINKNTEINPVDNSNNESINETTNGATNGAEFDILSTDYVQNNTFDETYNNLATQIMNDMKNPE